MAQRGLTTEEVNDLWGMLEFDDDFQRQIDDFGRQIGSADDLVGELIDELLANQSEVPRLCGSLVEKHCGYSTHRAAWLD